MLAARYHLPAVYPARVFTELGGLLSYGSDGPALTREVIRTMAYAPKLAEDLARRPALIDAMLEPSFRRPVQTDTPGAREGRLRTQLDRADDFEGKLNAARRFHREEAFRIGYQLLQGALGPSDAGNAYADLADACVSALADVCEQDILSRFPGSIGRWSICALGKFGGRELTATSDLDMMLIYEPANDAGGTLSARFVQRLVAVVVGDGDFFPVQAAQRLFLGR